MKRNWSNYMSKIKKLLYTKYIKDVDVICEILDSRIPESSHNIDLEKISKNKKKIFILNKSDLSNINTTKKWIKYFNNQEKNIAIMTNNKNKFGINHFFRIINEINQTRLQLNNVKKYNKLKIMIIGTPNVGKSTFINNLLKQNMAKCGNKAGITRGFQWFNIHENIDLLDCPGIFCSKMNDINHFYLSLVGSMEESSLNLESIIYKLMEILINKHKNNIINYYNIKLPITNVNNINDIDITNVLYNIAIKRGLLLKKNDIDSDRLYKLLINDFKNGKIGNITLEYPNNDNIVIG